MQVGTYPTRNFATLGTFVTPHGWLGRFLFRLALRVATEVGPYLHLLAGGVQRMASEDSVEYFIHGPLALLAVHVHRIGDFHDRSQRDGDVRRARKDASRLRRAPYPPYGMKSPCTAS